MYVSSHDGLDGTLTSHTRYTYTTELPAPKIKRHTMQASHVTLLPANTALYATSILESARRCVERRVKQSRQGLLIARLPFQGFVIEAKDKHEIRRGIRGAGRSFEINSHLIVVRLL